MNDLLAIIGIFALGTLITIGSIWLIQQFSDRQLKSRPAPESYMITPEEYLTEVLYRLPALLSVSQVDQMISEVQTRFRLNKNEAEEKLAGVIRSNSFERVTGARCTCFADSKSYGKFFHAPDCEFRKHLEGK